MTIIPRQAFRTVIAVAAILSVCISSEAKVHLIEVNDPATWSNSVLHSYRIGDTVQFNVPVIVNRNYGYSGFRGLTMSVRRVYSPTNQAKPLSDEYKEVTKLNSTATFTVTGCGYKRNGERLHNLKAVVTDNMELKYVSGKWEGNNTRAAIEHTLPNVDMTGEHNVLVCGANLEYYLVKSLGTGYGPDNSYEHQKQRAKVSKALAEIHADVYGLVEIEQGQEALGEIASDLTKLTGSHYNYINDGGAVDGSYTKAGYVYNSDRIQPVGIISQNNSIVKHRKMVQGFILIENNERVELVTFHTKYRDCLPKGWTEVL